MAGPSRRWSIAAKRRRRHRADAAASGCRNRIFGIRQTAQVFIPESIQKLSKAFDSAESALVSYETYFAPFRRKTETQNAVLFQIKRNRFI
jgi:hypothetical protein